MITTASVDGSASALSRPLLRAWFSSSINRPYHSCSAWRAQCTQGAITIICFNRRVQQRTATRQAGPPVHEVPNEGLDPLQWVVISSSPLVRALLTSAQA
jgi:hypothetical protein